MIAEALTNVAKHGRRAPHAWARVGFAVLLVEITDDRIGGADPYGNGPGGLRDRVLALCGEFEVAPMRSGGTRVAAAIPLPS